MSFINCGRLPAPARVALRVAYAVAAVVLIIAAVQQGGVGSWQFWAFLVMPDIALLVGASKGLERGQLHPRAVLLYNTLHRLLAPAGLAVLVLAAAPAWEARATPWLIAAAAWAAHICIDRSLGFGLRDRDGFQRR
ncbi:MAG: DUF4260 family protein [Candidatus Dormibacteraeota bacterium]|nr:DUF4260 family protein [Candidatus Dormibacteraeota bacterium]